MNADQLDKVFTGKMLALVHADVKRAFPSINLRTDCWVYSYGQTWEFHGPDGFYWHGRAHNNAEARYNGWSAYLRHKGVQS